MGHGMYREEFRNIYVNLKEIKYGSILDPVLFYCT
jgi:hypothetical protein